MENEDNQHSTSYPLLSKIDSPSDLRKLPVEKLTEVCSEIRGFLIESLSTNPGHFASNMGAVELTVALHYVFNTPYDRIVWDVGHQAYGHKLLTGRRDIFSTNRKFGGISGFPNPEESEYDTFTAGHASNSISAALGMSVASSLHNETPQRNVVAVIGDASISGGLAFEGLNNASTTPNNLLIILNDNDMSIDHNVGALNSYLTNINTTRGYNKFRLNLYKILKKLHLVTERQRNFILRFNNSLKSILGKHQNIFEGLNIRYFGPFDGHDIEKIVRVLNDIKDMNGPRLLHLRTIKGKGFAPAEKDPAQWHAPGKFDPATGKLQSDSGNGCAKYQDVFGETLLELARQNDKIIGITAAMPSGTSISIMQAQMPHRVFDVGISEGHAITFAGGLAKEGLLPYCAIYSSFLQRAYDQIIHDVAIMKLPVTFCIDRSGIVGEDGVTHHGVFDLGYLRIIPNFIIAAPRNEETLRNLLFTSQATDHGPMAIRYPRGKGQNPDWHTPMREISIGKGIKMTDGNDIVVISLGTIGNMAGKAVTRANSEGISTAWYDMIFLKPLDSGLLKDAAEKGVTIITVEDGVKNGGLGSAVTEWLNDNGYSNRVIRLGVPDNFVTHGRVPELMAQCRMDEEAIYQTIVETIQNETK